ncbi:Fibulin-1 [Halotydeus destructor]|nr:Fibulin-1 [Halotydeus destructor]
MDTGSCQDCRRVRPRRHNCPIGYVCRNTDRQPSGGERPSCPPGSAHAANGSCVADCTSGFQFDYWKENCIDIDECTSGRGPCPDNAECINIPGSYQCQPRLACPVGFEPDQDGDQCVDQDECLTGKHGCSYDQTCRNTNGAYVCECPLGFQLDQNRICTDIDECEYYGSSLCGQDGECVNSLGSYRCSCKAGYRPSREGACVDIDECSEMSIKCGYDSVCTNLPGSYKCSCQKGFETSPDGTTCVDVDECTRGRMYNISSPCQGECLNYEGSFKCTCPRGYRLDQDGRSCIDIDECEVAGQQCDSVDDICLNIRGGFKCYSITCPANYVRDFARKNRCVRTRSPFACPPEMSDQECGSLMRQPLTISYNYLTFPANLPIPPSGHMDLFTMRGPSFSQAVVSFKLQLVSATSDGQLGPYELASKEHFDLRTSAHNEATLSLVRLTPGPQDIQLELNVRIRTNGEFGGTSKALIFIHVSENAY